jgi:DNA primase
MEVEKLLKAKNIEFIPRGKDYIIHCLNPEHEDNNPSLHIDKESGAMNCLSCGFKGSIFRYFNIDVSQIDIKIRNIKNKIAALNTKNINIPLNASFLKDEEFRGISAKTMEYFKSFRVDTITQLEGRICWPIFDIEGNIKYLHGRYEHSKLKDKYRNYPAESEKILFPPEPEILNNSIILVEGFIDMLNLYDKGLRNTVCAFGCTLVGKGDIGSQKVIKLFSNYKLLGVNKLYIMFDGDKAGRAGAKSLKEALKSNYVIELLDLPEGLDPGKMTKTQVLKLRKDLYGE